MRSQSFHQQQSQTQVQTQVFTPALAHSLEILQVSALELRDVLLKELESNPVLEELPPETLSLDQTFSPSPPSFNQTEENWNEYPQTPAYINSFPDTFHNDSSDALKKRQHFIESIATEKSLQEHIMDQAKFTSASPEELRALEYLIGSLDNKGFLSVTMEDLIKLSNLPEKAIKNALILLKQCDPPGLGSKDIQECLLIQLEVAGKTHSLPAKIIKDHFQLLLRRRIPELASKLNISIDETLRALDEIAMLDPTPGRKFLEDHNRLIVADASVEKIGDKWIVTLNNEYIPKIQLSKTYKEILTKEGLIPEEKAYLQEKMRSGKYILNAIEQRQKTIERITYALLELQEHFFEKGASGLQPLTMSTLANYLNLHETTIGRAIANKFLATPHGLFPYKYFFTSGIASLSEEKISSTAIKQSINQIIKSEPAHKPFSDQKIVEILSEKNINLSRRTVAKYREAMGILSTHLRRQY